MTEKHSHNILLDDDVVEQAKLLGGLSEVVNKYLRDGIMNKLDIVSEDEEQKQKMNELDIVSEDEEQKEQEQQEKQNLEEQKQNLEELDRRIKVLARNLQTLSESVKQQQDSKEVQKIKAIIVTQSKRIDDVYTFNHEVWNELIEVKERQVDNNAALERLLVRPPSVDVHPLSSRMTAVEKRLHALDGKNIPMPSLAYNR